MKHRLVISPTYMSLSSRIEIVAPRRQSRIKASSALMWGFIYGLNRHTMAKQIMIRMQ